MEVCEAMGLYKINYDGDEQWIEAATMYAAIEAWMNSIDVTDDPDDVVLIHRGDVIR
jgi:hypothetical protein